jgi:mono/diheme cytochrome c family protein
MRSKAIAKLRPPLLGLALAGFCAIAPAIADEATNEAGKEVYIKANCVGCHKWHGGGGGGYGGAALSLRETALEREQLVEVVRCGRPATGMPYHDRAAFRSGVECYGGLTRADLGSDMPPQAATFLRPEQIEAVVAYVQAEVQGKGPPTREDCAAFWGGDSRECQTMK